MLIAHYKLDGNANDSISGINGTVVGSPTWPAGKIGTCAYSATFGAGYITFPNTAFSFDRYDKFSISMWFKYTTGSNNSPRFDKLTWTVGAKGWRIYDDGNNGTIICRLADNHNVTDIVVSSSGCGDGNWHNLVWTYDGNGVTGGMVLYKDGIVVSSGGGGNITSSTTNNNSPVMLNFISYMDDVKIYNHVLSIKEVKELYKCKILHYKFDRQEEYTTNLIPYPLCSHNGTSFIYGYSPYDATSTWTFTYQSMVGNPINAPYVMRVTTGTTGYKYFSIFANVVTGGTYTFSYYSRLVNSGTSSNLGNGQLWRDTTVDRGVTGDFNPVHTNMWTRWSTTGTITAGGYLDYFIIHGSNILGGYAVDFCGFQLEMKDHSTPWTTGTRADVITDSSGYGNNGYKSKMDAKSKIGNRKYIY
jgi:hypothetical protein